MLWINVLFTEFPVHQADGRLFVYDSTVICSVPNSPHFFGDKPSVFLLLRSAKTHMFINNMVQSAYRYNTALMWIILAQCSLMQILTILRSKHMRLYSSLIYIKVFFFGFNKCAMSCISCINSRHYSHIFFM